MTFSSSKPLRNSWHLILTNKALSMSPALALTFAYPMLLSCIALSFSLQKSTYTLTATLLLMLSPVSLPSESLKGHDRFYFLCKIFTIIQNSTICIPPLATLQTYTSLEHIVSRQYSLLCRLRAGLSGVGCLDGLHNPDGFFFSPYTFLFA